MKITAKLISATVALALLGTACSSAPKTEAELYADLSEAFTSELEASSTDTDREVACAFQGFSESAITDEFDMSIQPAKRSTPAEISAIKEDGAAQGASKSFIAAMVDLAESEHGWAEYKVGNALVAGLSAACDNIRSN